MIRGRYPSRRPAFARPSLARLAAGATVALAALAAAPSLAQKAPDETAKGLKLADGLEATLWASEPGLVNPTDIDVDARGRVWVLEAANYRSTIKPWKILRPEGDRILILEDTDGDGKCDSYKVFYQGTDLQAPLGICVMGDKVVVSQSPSVRVFEIDSTGDKPKGPPTVAFGGFTGVDHDHGVHAGVFGPDGRFYFNTGNEGTKGLIVDGAGKPVVDSTGSELGNKAKQFRGREKAKGEIGYTDGMAFRCDPDFKNVETLGYNFRNNYELAVDSFGTVWQSDNDDDGNQGVRINFVMEGGNFGYKGPKGYDWKRDSAAFPGQTKQEAHWHLRWPGIVPNMLNTGGGSPTGILVYEGDLLPRKYRGALIHCDAGPNVVRAYVTSPSASAPTEVMKPGEATAEAGDKGTTDKGAGYKAEAVELIKGGDDKWFRPSDVTVAPDGSLFVADWYDPGVGGHNMQDKNDGEKNPTDWHHFRGRIYRVAPAGNKPATPKLDVTTTAGQIAGLRSPNLAVRYLAYTALAKGGAEANKALDEMFQKDANPRMRARALWLLARSADGKRHVEAALKDKDQDIRIAAFRAARLIKMDVPAVAATLVNDESMGLLREVAVAMNYEPADKAVPVLTKLAAKYDGKDRWYLEALGIGAQGKEEAFLAAWAKDHKDASPAVTERLAWRMKKADPTAAAANAKASAEGGRSDVAIPAVPAAQPAPAGQPTASKEGRRPFDFGGRVGATRPGTAAESRTAGPTAAAKVLPPPVRRGRAGEGAFLAVTVIEQGESHRATDPLPNPSPAHRGREPMPSGRTLRRGTELFHCAAPAAATNPPTTSPATAPAADALKDKDGNVLPPVEKLAEAKGDAKHGAAVYRLETVGCIRCHQVGNEGGEIGPPLTTIGEKLSRAQLVEAIVYPSNAILMGYENWQVKTKDGDVFDGLLTSETEETISLKDTTGKYTDIPVANIAKRSQQKVSIMPDGLNAAMTRQDLADLVEYLTTLKNP
jgi:putative membrane-bound dehydrogenase-like protein